jgi:hypothetical protein
MASRVKILAKLGLLIGGPVAILMTIFGTGVYCGVNAQHGVTSFEKNVLGMDVKVAPEDGEDAKKDDEDGEKKDGEKKDAEKADGDADGGEKKADKPPASDEKPQPAPDKTPAPTPSPDVAPTPTVTPVPSKSDFLVALPEPIDDTELSTRLARLRTLQVKVFVDPDLVAERSDWVHYATQLVSAASGSYKNLFGLELELVGVVKWEAATAALGRGQMLEDLRGRPAEGADLMIGLTAQGVEADRAAPKVAEGDQNGAIAVVYADARGGAPHLRPLLRELGHVFGAPDVTDVQSDAYQRGSWMSQAPVPEGSTPWVDPDSRRRILERKDLPLQETK